MQDSKVGADQLTTGGGVLGSSARGEVFGGMTLARFFWKPTVVKSSQKQSLDSKENHFDVIIVTNSS